MSWRRKREGERERRREKERREFWESVGMDSEVNSVEIE